MWKNLKITSTYFGHPGFINRLESFISKGDGIINTIYGDAIAGLITGKEQRQPERGGRVFIVQLCTIFQDTGVLELYSPFINDS